MNDTPATDPSADSIRGPGAWLMRVLPHLSTYRALPYRRRGALIREIAAAENRSQNAVYRELRAANYLIEKKVDLAKLKVRPPLMSVEAVAKVGRRDRQLEAQLLKDLISGTGSVRSFREAAGENIVSITRSLAAAPTPRTLSSILLDHVVAPKARRIQVWLADDADPPSPLVATVLIDERYWAAVVDVSAERALERCSETGVLSTLVALRRLVHSLVYCTEVEMPSVERLLTAWVMKRSGAPQVTQSLCHVLVDLPGSRTFSSGQEIIEAAAPANLSSA